MRRVRIGGLAGCAALALGVLSVAPSPRPLELTASQTTARLGIVANRSGASLARLNPVSLKRAGRPLALKGFSGVWSFAPDGRSLAMGVRPTAQAMTETLRFYGVARLRRLGRGVALGGPAAALAWLRPDRVLAYVNECCDNPNGAAAVIAIDAVARRIIARTRIDGSVLQIVRSPEALIVLVGPTNGIGPSRLEIFGPDGGRRSAPLNEISAGVTWPDDHAGAPIGTRRVPGLALDTTGNRAFVLAPDGTVALVDLASLAVAYHRWEEQKSATRRFADWLTPAAQAKGINGPALTARWLGDGLIAVAGTDETAVLDGQNMHISSRPLGLRIIDTRDWSASTLDSGADAFAVADGLLLARGSSWSSDSQPESGMGVVAYGADRAVRFRVLPGEAVWIGFVYRDRAYVSRSGQTALRIVDLASGQTVGTRRGDAPWPLVDDTVRLFG